MHPKPLIPAAHAPRPLRGFTLIELVMVIVILGALAAVALPKFIDISSEARLSALRSIAASISTGSANNLAAFKVGSPDSASVMSTAVCQIPISLSRFTSNKNLGTTYTLTADPAGTQDCSYGSGNATASCILTDKVSLQSTPLTIHCATPPSL